MDWNIIVSTVVGTVLAAFVLAFLKYIAKRFQAATFVDLCAAGFIFCFCATIGTLLWVFLADSPTRLFVYMLVCAAFDGICTSRLFFLVLSRLKETTKTLDDYLADAGTKHSRQ